MSRSGYIFYIMGKSSSGKDTVYKRLLADYDGDIKKVVTYTTRPIREGERDGEEYFFVGEDEFLAMKESGVIIEDRAYDTACGLWRYFTADDEQLKGLGSGERYLMVGTLESYGAMREYFGDERIVPIYIELDDGERLFRALTRERQEKLPKYKELCRRFLADCEDFSEENLSRAGIDRRFVNDDLDECLRLCRGVIDGYQG